MAVKPRVVVCAAVRSLINPFIIWVGPRHFDMTMREYMPGKIDGEQGFIDQFGKFMTRQEAWKVAEAAGQIKYRCGGDEGKLFSENLY